MALITAWHKLSFAQKKDIVLSYMSDYLSTPSFSRCKSKKLRKELGKCMRLFVNNVMDKNSNKNDLIVMIYNMVEDDQGIYIVETFLESFYACR